jgi:hypothetical protein
MCWARNKLSRQAQLDDRDQCLFAIPGLLHRFRSMALRCCGPSPLNLCWDFRIAASIQGCNPSPSSNFT